MERHYKVKPCAVCGNDFTPRSGVQKACSDACKAEARAKGLRLRRGAAKAKPSSAGAGGQTAGEEVVDIKAEVAKALGVAPRLDDLGPAHKGNGRDASRPDVSRRARKPAARPAARQERDSNDMPKLELDLSPLAEYIQAVVQQEIRSAVKDVLREYFQGLLK